MAKPLPSDIFDDVSELINEKDRIVRDNQERLERKDIVRRFVNLRDTLSEQEKEDLGREEITNFGSTFRAAAINISPIESMVLGTDNLAKVTIDTDNPIKDASLSTEVNKLINQFIFNESEKFDSFWRTVAGEGYIAGGGPAVFDDSDSGLFPRYAMDLIFPPDAGLCAEDIPFAFEYRPMSVKDLKELRESVGDSEGAFVDGKAIDSMIETIRESVQGQSTTSTVGGASDILLDSDSIRDDDVNQETKLDVWKYWEIRCDDNGQYVSMVVFIDGADLTKKEDSVPTQMVIAQDERAFDHSSEWLTMMIFDEEVGGEKTIATLRGLAEAHYPASVMLEELRNLQLEGAMMTARPTLKYNEMLDPDEALDFRLGVDQFAPQGVDDFLQLPNGTNQLNPIINDMIQTVSGIAATDRANNARGQELRQQAVERQQNNTSISNNRIIKAYKKLDRLLTIMVGRLFRLQPEPNTPDYETFKWFRECLIERIVYVYELESVPTTDGPSKKAKAAAEEFLEKLGERRWGRYKNFRVRASRNASGFDRPTELENANFMVQLIDSGKVSPQLIPGLLKVAALYQTQNPDIVELISQDPAPIKADQIQIASMEWAAILNRAMAGELFPLNASDIHEDHFETHLTDLIGMVNSHGMRPWDQLSVQQFSAAVEHINLHIQALAGRANSEGTMARLFPQFQEVIGMAMAIIQVLSQQEQEQVQDDDPDADLKRAKTAKIFADIEMMGRKYGLDLADRRGVESQRLARIRQADERQRLMERQQIVGEIQKNQELRLKAAGQLQKDRS